MGTGVMANKRKSKTVLIIEDEADIQNFVSRVLELEGYQTLQANDGEKGMEIIRENPVALVLLDLRLPGRDGWSILTEIRQDIELSKIPVIVITAVADAPQRKRTLHMGADKYLVKPLSAHSLAKNIASVLH
jgi:DNA-binding response OmpR family regulator